MIPQRLTLVIAASALCLGWTMAGPTPRQGPGDQHSLTGCDPEVPPDPISSDDPFPLPLYYEVVPSISNLVSYRVRFWVPKQVKTAFSDYKFSTDTDVVRGFKADAIHTVEFIYDKSASDKEKALTMVLDNTDKPKKPIEAYPYFGTFDTADAYVPKPAMQVISVKKDDKKVIVYVGFHGIRTAFTLFDA